MSWGCSLLSRIQGIDLGKVKTFVVKHKWRILILLIVIYADNKAYDHFFPAPDKRGGPQTVVTMVLDKKDVPIIIESTGTVVAASIVDIRPVVTNTVKEIHIKEGQDVKKGQLLFTLDDRNDRANYDKAKALADDAQRQLQRAKELVAKLEANVRLVSVGIDTLTPGANAGAIILARCAITKIQINPPTK